MVRSKEKAAMSAEEWFNGANEQPIVHSLQPEGELAIGFSLLYWYDTESFLTSDTNQII